jgi:hypothetical protein
LRFPRDTASQAAAIPVPFTLFRGELRHAPSEERGWPEVEEAGESLHKAAELDTVDAAISYNHSNNWRVTMEYCRSFVTLARHGLIIASAIAAFCTQTAAGPVVYHVTVNTSSVSGTSGFLEMQFNPGAVSTQLATATVSSFNGGGGTLGSADPNIGDVGGTLPGSLTFINDQALNDYFQGFTFGSGLSFVLTLDGPAITSPNGIATAGSTFALSFFDSAVTPILTNQGALSGAAGMVDINVDGTTTATAFPNGTAPSVVTFAAPGLVPEPSTLALLASGVLLIGFGVARRRHSNRQPAA